jgi:hypothetical protein
MNVVSLIMFVFSLLVSEIRTLQYVLRTVFLCSVSEGCTRVMERGSGGWAFSINQSTLSNFDARYARSRRE